MDTAQYDLWMMSAVIFVPSLFALVLMICMTLAAKDVRRLH